jgi:hypothetical protein
MTWLNEGARVALVCLGALAVGLPAASARADDCAPVEESAGADALLEVADCRGKAGDLIGERTALGEALERLEAGDPRVTTVNLRLDALTKLIPQLTISLWDAAPEGTEVKLDGRLLDASEIGAPIEVNPGEHSVAVTAPGFEPAEIGVVARPNDTLEMTAMLKKGEKLTVVREVPAPAAPPGREEGWDPTPLGIALTVLGATSLIAAGITGGMFLRDRGIVDDECDEDALCTRDGVEAADRAEVLGTVSTVTAIGGGVLATAGIAILIGAAVSRDDDDGGEAWLPVVSPSELGLVYQGRF